MFIFRGRCLSSQYVCLDTSTYPLIDTPVLPGDPIPALFFLMVTEIRNHGKIASPQKGGEGVQGGGPRRDSGTLLPILHASTRRCASP